MADIKKFLSFWYFQYLLHTGLYMLESWERSIFNSLLLAFVATASYTTYLFLPGHLIMLQRFVENYIIGHPDMSAAGVGEAAAHSQPHTEM